MIIQNINSAGDTLNVTLTDRSYRLRQVMGEDSLYLYFSSPNYTNIAVGAYVDYQGARYYLHKPDNFKKNHTRNYEYSLTLTSEMASLGKYKMRDAAEKLLKFPFTAKPQQHLQMLVDNLNQRESGWTVGVCIDAPEKLISYNHTNLSEALQMIAEAFETEWEIKNKTIHLKKVEYNYINPLALSYGKGNGFLPGLGRSNVDDKAAIEILHVQGGERNIDYSKYGTRELALPKGQTYEYEGRYYYVKSDGLSIQRADKPISTKVEDSLDLSHIYPQRVGEVSEVVIVDAANHLYDFKDASIPADLDYQTSVMAGETMTVVFQSGMLAGREFEIDSYVHADRLFRIVPQEQDGLTLPDALFRPVMGDKYAVFGIQLPDAYIRDDATQTGASWDLFKEAAKYLYENETPRFTFTGELDGIWAKQDWLNIGGKIVLGGFVNFSDPQFFPTGELIRIVGVKDYVNNPYSPEIELSNTPVSGGVMSEIGKIKAQEVVEDTNHKQAISYTKRRFRSAQETMEMLSEAIDGFGSGINPLTVQSMSMLVGDESLQYRFVSGKVDPVQIVHNISFDNTSKILTAPGAWMQHMTVGITTLTTKAHTYKFWNVAAFASPALVVATKPYYFYIKASKTSEAATFVLSETAIKMEAVAGFYHFLVGFLNSEIGNERSFATMYGFSEVLPGRITTSKIHADTVEVTELFAKQIYSSGAKIGGVDIAPKAITDNDIDGLRLGNLITFNPTTGREGIMFGKHNNKYKVFIGNATDNITFDGDKLMLSGFPMLGTGTAVGVSELGNFFEIINKGGADQYLRAKVPLASAGEITAFATNGYVPASFWDSMPVAGENLLGAIRVGAGLTIDGNGILSANVQSGGASTWSELLSKPTWLNHSTIELFETGHGHDWAKITGKPSTYTPSAHTHTIANITSLQSILDGKLATGATAANSGQLGGFNASDYTRRNANETVTGNWTFSNNSQPTITESPNTQKTVMYIRGYHENGLVVHSGGFGIGANSDIFRASAIGEGYIEVPRFVVKSTGNVGIGTTAPTERLHVVGNGLFTGNVTAQKGTLSSLDVTGDIKLGTALNALIKYDAVNDVIRFNKTIVSDYDVVAYADGGQDLPSIFDNLPKASTSSFGLVKIGSGISVAGGVISVDGDQFDLSNYYTKVQSDGRFKPIGYQPTWAQVTGKPSTYTPTTHGHTWSELSGIPSTFTPSAHNHIIGDVEGLQTALNGKLGTGAQAYDSARLGGQLVSKYTRRDVNETITGIYEFSNGIKAPTKFQHPDLFTTSGFFRSNTAPLSYFIQLQHPESSDHSIQIGNNYEQDELRFRAKNKSSGYGSLYRLWHSGNSNNSSTDWNARNLVATGNITAQGEVTAYSDRRLKSHLSIISNPLSKINQLTGYTYDKDGKRSAGLIAQDVRSILPEAVHGVETATSYLSINDAGVTGLMIEGIKEVNKKTVNLDERVKILEKENKELKLKLGI